VEGWFETGPGKTQDRKAEQKDVRERTTEPTKLLIRKAVAFFPARDETKMNQVWCVLTAACGVETALFPDIFEMSPKGTVTSSPAGRMKLRAHNQETQQNIKIEGTKLRSC
jgi:hypothetical protein